MMSKPVHAMVWGCVAAVLALVWVGASSADKPPAKTIPLADLHNHPVMGSLGHPLGTIIVVEGVVADGSHANTKADAGHTLLRIQVVNGKRLAQESVFHFDSLLDRVEKPKVKSAFKYSGYETGGFTGTPTKAFDYVGLVATTGYGFTSNFIVLKDEARAND